MNTSESKEMYLETILILKEEKGIVKSIDIARRMNFSKPSVSRAVKQLKEEDFIIVNKDNSIELSEKGANLASTIYNRHIILSEFLVKLGVSEDVAKEDACRVEHVISKETTLKIKEFLNK